MKIFFKKNSPSFITLSIRQANLKACLSTKQGFTLIELLVVISIIGILSSLTMVSLNNTRSKARDAKRVSDIRQLQLALELCFNEGQAYPNVSGTTLLATDVCTSPGNPTVPLGKFINPVPENPFPGGSDYIYTSISPLEYIIEFELEGHTGRLGSGMHTASEQGVL